MFAHLHARPLDVNLGRPFRYQDNITYLCDIGYVLGDGSNKMTLTCGQDGQWSGGLPECQAAMCMEEPVPSGAIAGTNNLTYQAVGEITCNVSGVRNETITRYCQYNQTSDSYMFTGQPIRCNVIDCGQPDTITGANITVVSTLYPSSFTVTCKDLYSLAGNSSKYDNIVRCTADGYWDYGDLRCEGATCSDPGRPPDGRQVAVDTYEEGKLVRYVCDRPGYEPDPPYPLLCEVAGSNLTWNASAPTCVDRESPVFTFCPGPFTVAKLSELFTMPFPNATDNSGMIRDIQVSPVDFHGYGMWIEQDMNVTYTAYDHANNTATCVVNIRLKDQEPPVISCPNSTTLVILEENSQLVITQGGQLQGNYSSMFMAMATDNVTPRGEMTFTYSPPSQTLTSAMVDKRITFTATATDMAGNNASCSYDVVPKASPCSTWYLPTPKFGTKTCTTSNTTSTCTTTCNSGYGFHGGQASIVYTCDTSADQPEWSNNGTVQDCVAPEIMAIYTAIVQETGSSTPGLVYTTVNATILSSCIQPYITELDSLIATVAANLSNVCQTVTGLSNIYIELNQSTTSLDVVGQQLTVPLTLRILPSSLQRVNVFDCVTTLNNHIRYLESGAMDRFMAARALGFVPSVGSCGQLNLPSGTRYEEVGGFICPSNLVRNDQLCLPCPTGTFRDGAACTPCSPGQYQDEQAQTQCKSCPEGFTSLYAGSNRLEQCIEYCSEGMISDTGLAPCTMCPADTYFSNRTHCTPCPVGTTTNGVEGAKNSSGCKTECRPGYFSYNGRESCTACPLNFYQNSTGQTTCSRCSTDSVTTQVASDSIDNCTSQSSLCNRNDTCQNGGTCTVLGHVEQCLCPDGYTGRYCEDTINPCDSSPCFYNGTCVPLGGLQFRCDCYSAIVCTMVNETSNQTYSGGADEASTVPSLAACREKCVNSSQCSAITFSSSSCIIFYALSGRALTASSQAVVTFTKSCRNVSDFSGQFCESETNHCLSNDCQNGGMCQDLVGGFKCLCPSNSIYSGPKCTDSTPVCDQPANACQNGGTCRPIFGNIRSVCNCVAGFTGRNSFCPDGQEGNGTSCTACLRGYYKDNSKSPLSKFLPCELCPIDKITAGNGTTRETDCNIGNCTAGYYIHSSNNSCVPCPLNSYQPDKWQTSCILCPDNKTTATMATTALTECKYRCPLGQEDQSGTCRPCAIGSYKDTDGPESCTLCSNGRLTRNQGSTNESQCDQVNCPPGTKNEANTCAVCSVGTYQDQSGQYACMSCPVYTNTVNSSSTSLQDCLSLCNDSLPTKYCEQGTCQLKTTGQPECICNPNYEGEFCHIHSDLRSELSFEAVVGLSVGFAALLTVLGIFGICYFCFKVRKTGKPSKALSTASRNGYFYNGYGPEDWNYYNGYYDGYGTPVGENGYDNRLGQTSEAMASYPYHRSAYQYYEDTDGQPVDLTAFEETLHSDFTTPKSYFSRYN
ncbi:sushi, von Willebrand factor type A, EGF and pentraxin domain-containing protein 1-like [Lingula anatina]|uniref:Sushi, von Willebrand factor type A, EGF and pentraxin domain-containing protein 1-like n=1 Tax=Lingula anatina TaxID=7574 RepID=A0A1S3H208_LINAN|nr:sushi, von Willebrand factor type A, EGF and pentraxin domain-containing protein 1-like [Lingula anatina]|eukprot:XP_013380053.1 sushi, von Willebrand factor type A, EGF and pentraxin domain-containing protein 1-like [Lingula anatina]